MDNENKLETYLLKQGYLKVKHIPGGYIAVMSLLYTWALCIDLDQWGYERRYCYEDRALALSAFEAMTNIDDEPLSGYVSKRPK